MDLNQKILAGLLASSGLPGILALPVGVVLTLGFLFYMKKRQNA